MLRAVHAATIAVLEDNGVDTDKFKGRSAGLSGAVQSAEPGSPDDYKV